MFPKRTTKSSSSKKIVFVASEVKGAIIYENTFLVSNENFKLRVTLWKSLGLGTMIAQLLPTVIGLRPSKFNWLRKKISLF